jgi:ubiquitin thioesterase OTU1
MGWQTIDLRIRHPEGSQVVSTLSENSCICDLKKEISKISNIPASRIALKIGYPPQRLDFPENTTLGNIGIQSGETIIAEEDLDAPKTNLNAVNVNSHTQRTSPKKEKMVTEPNNFSQIPNPEGLIMIRRVIPADNSCLFNSIAYALENQSKNKSRDLRDIVAGYIMSDPERYSEVVLERPNHKYCEWIQKSDSWGGAIELEIFSRHYEVEICAVDIENGIGSVFGSDQGYKERIYVLYDGIHYDILVRNISEDMDSSMDITVFSPIDKFAYEGALTLARELKAKKQFTNVSKFTIQCGVCYDKFTGEKEAVQHNKETGHINFQEVSSS